MSCAALTKRRSIKIEAQTTDAIPRVISSVPASRTHLSPKLATAFQLQASSAPTAIVFCEGNFVKVDGKTANGLIRHSQAYWIVSIIDSLHDGQDSGQVLDGLINNIPIFRDLRSAVMHEPRIPYFFDTNIALAGATPVPTRYYIWLMPETQIFKSNCNNTPH